jgi:NAD(P)-dependent dehydrogenase (short-subunit alcohol dehydrogenase family)
VTRDRESDVGNEDRLAGRVAVITGAGSGIGRATALRFAAEGARVVVNDIDPDAAAETTDEITERGGTALAHACDVGVSADVDDMVAIAVARFGRLDVLHNNAGYGRSGRVADVDDETFDEMLRVNLSGTMYGMRAALRVMIPQGSGSIINTASNAGFGAATDRASYGAAKAAVINLTKSAAVENGRHGIRVNAICPGPIETPAFRRFAPDLAFYSAQIPLGRLGRAEDVAALALFLATDEAAFISGVAIPIDGAMMARLPAPFLTPEDVTGPY